MTGNCWIFGAEGGNRTRTILANPRILSPANSGLQFKNNTLLSAKSPFLRSPILAGIARNHGIDTFFDTFDTYKTAMNTAQDRAGYYRHDARTGGFMEWRGST
jgi:hypothetical protein